MSNLEFIEILIEENKKEIEIIKNMIVEDDKYPSIKKLNEENLKSIEELLAHLQQTKTILEAWEELNKTFEIGVDEQIDEIYIKGKNYYGNERTIWGYSKDGTLRVKKALEVEDDR